MASESQRSEDAPRPSPRFLTIQRNTCPEECGTCPPDGRVKAHCNCIGRKAPDQLIKFIKPVKILRIYGSLSAAKIDEQVRMANKVWAQAGIELRPEIRSLDRDQTKELLLVDEKGRPRLVKLDQDKYGQFAYLPTRLLIGAAGDPALTVPAGKTADAFVVYFVADFNACGKDEDAVGCAFEEAPPGFTIFVERRAQSATLAHEVGHIWIDKAPDDHEPDRANVMYATATKTGLTDEQISRARASLGLGPLRCRPAGANDSELEAIRKEQQQAENQPALERAFHGKYGGTSWVGTIEVNGSFRTSRIYVRKPYNNSPEVIVRYTYKNRWDDVVEVPGRDGNSVAHAKVEEGRLEFEWHEGSQQGMATFQLAGADRLRGSWGVGASKINGGSWDVAKDGS